LNSLEQSFTTAKLNAERSLHKYGRHPWSPTLRQAQLQVYFYKLWLSQFTTGNDYSNQRNKLQVTGIENPTTRTHTQTLLRQAQLNMRKVKLQATQLRDKHLEERVDFANI